MLRSISVAALSSLLVLSACGAEPSPDPVEQIIVREPGSAPAATPAAAVNAVGDQASAMIAEGKAVFANCAVCHTLDKDAAHGAGPNLFGIVGQAAGAADGFGYSDALKASGIKWTAAELDSYIADPAAKVPGTTMIAGAISDPVKRKAVIAYIKRASAS